MKKILVITTGGTIAMSEVKPGQGPVPALRGEDLVKKIPHIANYAEVSIEDFYNIPSPLMTPQKMLNLSNFISENIDKYDGFVVTHGTDSIEETTYFVQLTTFTKKPIIFTAAMRSNYELGLDGPRNLLNSIRAAAADCSYGRDVMLCINDQLFSAREVYKSSTFLTNAFSAPNYGILGLIDVDRIIYHRRMSYPEKYKVKNLEDRVDIIKIYTGLDDRFINTSLDSGAKGLVIEAFGRGNVSLGVLKGIKRAIDMKIPVIITSKVPNGRVLGVYGYEGGGKGLEQMGAIMGEDLNSEKARLKLIVLLSAGFTQEEIKQSFSANNFYNG